MEYLSNKSFKHCTLVLCEYLYIASKCSLLPQNANVLDLSSRECELIDGAS